MAKNIITPMAIVIAMMMSVVSMVRPTAVSTESIAKIMSTTTIWAMTPAIEPPGERASSAASASSVSSVVL